MEVSLSARLVVRVTDPQSVQSRWSRPVVVATYLLVLCACSPDPTAAPPVAPPPRPTITVCERGNPNPVRLAVDDSARGYAALATREAHLVDLRVDRTRTRNDGFVFRRITDALAEARRIRRSALGGGCVITISVGAGVYVGTTVAGDTVRETLPLVIDFERVALRGNTPVIVDADSVPPAEAPSPTAGEDPRRTTVMPSPPLRIVGGTSQTGISEPIIVVHGMDDLSVHTVEISGFLLHSGHAEGDTVLGGKGILTMRARNVHIDANIFLGNFTERIDLRGGSANVSRNYLGGAGDTCDICLAGPGTFRVAKNRLAQGGIPGVLVLPTAVLPVPIGVTQFVPSGQATVDAEITGNHINGHQRVPVGVAIRVATVGINAANVSGTAHVRITDNVLTNNRFGVIVEAGSTLRGDAFVQLAGNVYRAICQANVYLSFARHTTGLGLANTPYLRNSTYRVTLDRGTVPNSVWFAHPAGLGNVLILDDSTIANGTRNSYTPTRECR